MAAKRTFHIDRADAEACREYDWRSPSTKMMATPSSLRFAALKRNWHAP